MAQPTHFADYVTVVTNIDRKKYGKRIVPMRVLILGMARTGTECEVSRPKQTSARRTLPNTRKIALKKALQLMGIYEVYHGYSNLFDNPRDNEMWLEALEAKYDGKGKPYGRAEFDKLLGHCQAVSDIPALCFAEELIAAYPEAKVILTVRDVDSWYQ